MEPTRTRPQKHGFGGTVEPTRTRPQKHGFGVTVEPTRTRPQTLLTDWFSRSLCRTRSPTAGQNLGISSRSSAASAANGSRTAPQYAVNVSTGECACVVSGMHAHMEVLCAPYLPVYKSHPSSP